LELELFPTVHSVARCGVRVVTYGVMGSDLRGEKREAETEREREIAFFLTITTKLFEHDNH
jgi:hypothetical protein